MGCRTLLWNCRCAPLFVIASRDRYRTIADPGFETTISWGDIDVRDWIQDGIFR